MAHIIELIERRRLPRIIKRNLRDNLNPFEITEEA